MAPLQRRRRHWRDRWLWRLTAGIAALIGTAAVIVGAPVVLAEVAGNPLPRHLPSVDELGRALTSPDDGTLFLRLLALVGWLAWATLTISLLVEIPAQLRGRRPVRIPGLGIQQRVAAALVGAMIAIFAEASVSAAVLPPSSATAVSVAMHAPHGMVAATPVNVVRPVQRPVYIVKKHDYLGRIAQRFTGEFDRYQQIAALNPRLVRNPNRIQPGWRLTLPADAHDRGVIRHAAGRLLVPLPPAGDGTGAGTGNGNGNGSGTGTGQVPAPSQAPAKVTPSHPAATHPAVPIDPAANDESKPDTDHTGTLAAGAGLAVAGVLAAHVIIRRRIRRIHQRRLRRRRTTEVYGPFLETDAEARERARHRAADRMDGALRRLAVGLRGRAPWEMPDIAAAWQHGGELAVILTAPCPDPPEPYDAQWPNTWSLQATTRLPDSSSAPSLLPGLLKLGTWPQGGELFVDGERTGLLTLVGDPQRCDDLLRCLAAEAAGASWADGASVLVAGLSAADMRALGTLTNGRVRTSGSIYDAVARIGKRAAANSAVLQDTETVDTLAARANNVTATTWSTHLLFIADPWGEHTEQLLDLDALLADLGRVGVVVVATHPTGTRWSATVSSEGTLHMAWLAVTGAQAGRLTSDELAAMAQALGDTRRSPSQPAGARHRLRT